MRGRRIIRHKFKKKPSKYRSIKTVVDEIQFDSKAEARYYQDLKLRVQAGEVLFFLRQVPIHLPGGTKLVVDFLEFHTDGTAHFTDKKSEPTRKKEAYRIKKREVEHHYPFDIEEV